MKKSTFHLSILSPEKSIFEGDAESITLPGKLGSFTILAHHAPIVSSLKKGTLLYSTGGQEQDFDINGGFVEMDGETVSVCIS